MRLFDGSLVSVFKYQPEGTMNNPKKSLSSWQSLSWAGGAFKDIRTKFSRVLIIFF